MPGSPACQQAPGVATLQPHDRGTALDTNRQIIAAPAVSRRKSFTVVLLIELWERFGYYGMQAILLLFLVQRLGFADADANLLWGAFSALLYAAPALGGWIGDRLLGTRHTMLIGAATLMSGYALLAVPAERLGLAANGASLYGALAIIIVGNGLFKSNAANLVRRIYEGDDARLDSAFTIYYMAVNLGSTVSILFTPWMAGRFGWHPAFAVAALGLAVGLASYAVLRRWLAHVGTQRDLAPLPLRRLAGLLAGIVLAALLASLVLQHAQVARACVWVAGLATIGLWIWIYRRSHAAERAGLMVMYVLTGEVLLFFVFYQQTATSLLLFSLRNVSLEFAILGHHLFTWSPAQFQAFDPIWIVVLTPILVWLYNRAETRGWRIPVALKFAAGFAANAAAFLVWWLCAATSGQPLVSSWVMVWAYGLFSAGELLTSGLGLAVVARYVPARMSGFMMGSYYLAIGVALYIGSTIANLAAIDKAIPTTATATLAIYASLFRTLFAVAASALLLCLALLPWLARLDRRHQDGAAATSDPLA